MRRGAAAHVYEHCWVVGFLSVDSVNPNRMSLSHALEELFRAADGAAQTFFTHFLFTRCYVCGGYGPLQMSCYGSQLSILKTKPERT